MQDTYAAIALIANQGTNIIWESDSTLSIDIPLSPETIPHLALLNETPHLTDCKINGSRTPFSAKTFNDNQGKILNATLSLPIPNAEFAIVKDLQSLLQRPEFYTTTPKHLYRITERTDIIPDDYSDAVMLSSILKTLADHTKDENGIVTCFFYDGAKISIPISFCADDLTPLNGVSDLATSFIAPRLPERIKIFKNVITKISISSPNTNATFPHIIKHFSTLKQTFEQDWALYVSDFSLDEILDTLEEKIIKIADKISASLSDLQKTMITIPLAIIFAAPRMDTTTVQSPSNSLILLSVWIFSAFTWVFFSSHKRTLNFIAAEINEQENFVKSKHPGLSEKITPKFATLKNRCSDQDRYRKTIGSLMWVSVIILTVIYFKENLPNIPTHTSNHTKIEQQYIQNHYWRNKCSSATTSPAFLYKKDLSLKQETGAE